MRIFIVLIWCFWFVGVDAQNRSIVFREGNWEKILKQAKKEKKLIFVDCYTSWCGPCKMLAKNVFTQDKVADFYNTEFVCVKMDMEKGEGPALPPLSLYCCWSWAGRRCAPYGQRKIPLSVMRYASSRPRGFCGGGFSILGR